MNQQQQQQMMGQQQQQQRPPQQQQQQYRPSNASAAPSRPPPRASRPTDKNLPANLDSFVPESRLFMQLVDLEKRLDATIQRKRLDVLDTIKKLPTQQRQLRIFLSNLAADQYVEEGVMDSQLDNIKCPSWTLKIEGRLLESTIPLPRGAKPAVAKKFSHFVKSVMVEIQRDSAGLYPDSNIIEWHKQPGVSDCDGFEIKRKGDANVPVKIFIHLAHLPEKFKLSHDLSTLLDIHTDTKSNIIMALWQYVKKNKLQDADDRRYINCDEDLKQIFGYMRLMFPQIPEFLNHHLLPADPMILEYTVRVDKEYHIGQYAFDVDVELHDESTMLQQQQLISEIPAALSQKVSAYDEKIAHLLILINQTKLKRDFFQAFSTDPAGFLKKWMASQGKDLALVLGDVQVDAAEARLASFYDQPWVHEAVFRYLNEQTRR